MAAKEAAAAARKAVAKAESLESEIAALKAAIGQQRDPALLSQQEQEQLEQKPGLKAQHDLAASVLKLAGAALRELRNEDVSAARVGAALMSLDEGAPPF